jgi:hypothetical protein
MEVITTTPEQLVWRDNPAIDGSKIALLSGDPTQSEMVVVRIALPRFSEQMPHCHPYAEYATVISGSVGFGLGDVFNIFIGSMYDAGSFTLMPARQRHFIWTGKEPAILQLHYIGPFQSWFME